MTDPIIFDLAAYVMKRKQNRFIYIHMLVIVYLISAFSWWAILLFKKNKEVHQLKIELHELAPTQSMEGIEANFQKQKKMIIGEGLVFGLSILFGLFLINRAFRSEIQINKRLNDFLLSVTHELKTPIASLKLSNQTLQKNNLSPAIRSELIKANLEETSRLETQVNNILAAAQLEQAYQFNFEETDLNQLIESCIRRFNRAHPNREILYTPSDDINLPLDAEAFTRVLDNLLSNAIKYSPLETKVEIKSQLNKDRILLQFCDQGKGINNDQKKLILQKFYRIENEDTRSAQGTGLGLWIASKIVEAHKGKILFRDNNPRGTVVEVNLPFRR